MSKEKMSLVTDEIRAKAIIYRGKETIKEQTQRLLREVGLPNGLLPMDDAEECGHVEETGFVWLKQKTKIEHKFDKVGKLVSYGTEVTAYAEPTKIKKLTGVKVKELMMWVTISEITVPVMNGEKVTFKSNFGPSMIYPAEAFMAKPDDKNEAAQVKTEPNDKNETAQVKAEPNDKNETAQVQARPNDETNTAQVKADPIDNNESAQVKEV